MKHPDQPRQFGFSRRSSAEMQAVRPPAERRRLSADGECVLCNGPGSQMLTSADGGALCEGCALENHDVAPPDAVCSLCGSVEPPLRGTADRAICDACLSYARAMIRGDDL